MTVNLYESVFGGHVGGNDNASSTAAIDLSRKDSKVSYSELQELVDAVGIAAKFCAKEPVALVLPNSLELIAGLLAVWSHGAAAAPLNPSYTSAEFKTLFEDLGVKKVLVLPGADELKEALKEASADLNIIEVSMDREQNNASSQRTQPPANQDDNTALYLHTSGTTGKPKAVPLRHSNLLRGARNVAETYGLDKTNRTYLLQVLFHIHGIVAGLLAPLITGGSIVIPPGGNLDASRAWSDFEENDCDWVTGTPSILQTLLAAPCPNPVPNIRFIRSCSSPLLPTVFEVLRKRFNCPIVEAYAMTEASHQMCSNRLDLFSSGTVGPESGGTKICIWDGGNEACQLGAEGEVCVSGDNVMTGYEGVSEETNKKAFWYGVDERGNEARWFRTGDKGVLSTDGHRRLTLIGRLSEMINRGGEKISPVECDEALMLAADDVKEAACFAVSDDFYGQEIEAAVVLKPGSKLDEPKLQQLLEKRLAKFKVPKRIHFCEDKIPKGPTGKIQRKNLAQLFGGGSDRQGKLSASDIDGYAIIDSALGLTPGQAKKQSQATLLELGANSMGLVRIAASFKKKMGTQLSMATLFSFPSVEAVVNMAKKADSGTGDEAESLSKPDPFSLLPVDKSGLDRICQQAGLSIDDLEDAYPLSATQTAYFDVLVGDDQDSETMWMLNRYSIAKGTDAKRLVYALEKLQAHEESLRWTLSSAPNIGWVVLQSRPGLDNRIEEISCKTEKEATQALDSRLTACRHRTGAKTAMLYVLKIEQELELAFIESHGFTEGQGRDLIMDSLNKAYRDEDMDAYIPYSIFVDHHPTGSDAPRIVDFWEKEKAAVEHSEGSEWQLKQESLVNPVDFAKDRLEALGVTQSAKGPFRELSVQVGMTLPLVVESIFALSLALYFAQQDPAFARGHVVYDRGISMRTADPHFSGLRPFTGSYHPNPLLLDVARSSLWSYMQYFKGVTQLREQNVGVNSMPNVANHSVGFTWRFSDDGDQKDDSLSSDQLVTGVKDEKMAMRAFKMCYANANRKGNDGVTIAIGFHQKWLENQRQNGSKVEFIDICVKALEFFAERHKELAGLSWRDLQQVVMG